MNEKLKQIDNELKEYIQSISKEQLDAELNELDNDNQDTNVYPEVIELSKDLFTKVCKYRLKTFTDWTGTYVESKDQCKSVNEFVDELWKDLV